VIVSSGTESANEPNSGSSPSQDDLNQDGDDKSHAEEGGREEENVENNEEENEENDENDESNENNNAGSTHEGQNSVDNETEPATDCLVVVMYGDNGKTQPLSLKSGEPCAVDGVPSGTAQEYKVGFNISMCFTEYQACLSMC
jgi:hypothetical protein